MGERKKDPMDVPAVLEGLNAALALQYASAVNYTVVAGSVFGLEYAALGPQLGQFAGAELEDARKLVEKIATLGGEPTTDVAAISWSADVRSAIESLIESENQTLDALHAVIPATGQESRSEALEHLLEHLIMRKQNQVDFLVRATRGPGSG